MKGLLLPLTAMLLTVGAQPAGAAFSGSNGTIAVERQGADGVALALVNADGTGDRGPVITTGPQNRDPSWAPDGRRLAFTSTRDGNEEIYVYDVDSGAQTRITFDAARDRDPAWSPDGTRLVFESTRSGNPDIYIVPATGGLPARLTFDPADDRQPAWSSTGTIAFASDRTDEFDLYAMAEDGTGLRRLTNADGPDLDPSWSPAGDQLAFAHATTGGNFDVRVIGADGSNTRPLVATPENEHFPTWSPDGTRIAYVAGTGGGQSVSVTAADGPQGTGSRVTSGTEPNWAPLPLPVGGPDAGSTLTIAPLGSRVLVAPATTEQPNTTPVLQAQLRGASEVPVGTSVNAAQGTIAIDAITTTPDGPNTVGHAEVSGGVFTISQVGTAEPTLKMRPGIRPCQNNASAARVPPEARMRIRARGRFRSVGGYGRGAARGTDWALRERCDGTIFQVFEGVVLVHDYVKKRSFEVRAGRCYLAAAPGRPGSKKPTGTCPPVGRKKTKQ